jgi:hypothetical protein
MRTGNSDGLDRSVTSLYPHPPEEFQMRKTLLFAALFAVGACAPKAEEPAAEAPAAEAAPAPAPAADSMAAPADSMARDTTKM